MEKARNHYKNPNEIHQFINLPIYKGLLVCCFLMLVEWFSVGGGEETLFNKSALHIVEFR
jgi:hypothetical protein